MARPEIRLLPTVPETDLAIIQVCEDTVWLRANANLCVKASEVPSDAHGMAYHDCAEQLLHLGFPEIRPAH